MVDEKELNKLIEEIVILLRAGLKPTIRGVIEKILDTPEKKRAYQSSDGRKSKDVEDESGISYSKITKLWKEWYGFGLGYMVSAQGGERFVRTLDLKEYGFEVPDIKPSRESD